jgi:hypothetical protein
MLYKKVVYKGYFYAITNPVISIDILTGLLTMAS